MRREGVALIGLVSGCCCQGEPPTPPQDLVGLWICPGGVTYEIEPDGRVEGWETPEEVRIGALTEVTAGQACLQIEAQTCARATPLPPEYEGIWAAGVTEITVRKDGYTVVLRDQLDPAGVPEEGVLVVAGSEVTFVSCVAPVVLPLTVGAAGLVWQGTALNHYEKPWYEKFEESKAGKVFEGFAPSPEALERHGDRDHDWD